jgi:hypothetical protein
LIYLLKEILIAGLFQVSRLRLRPKNPVKKIIPKIKGTDMMASSSDRKE